MTTIATSLTTFPPACTVDLLRQKAPRSAPLIPWASFYLILAPPGRGTSLESVYEGECGNILRWVVLVAS